MVFFSLFNMKRFSILFCIILLFSISLVSAETVKISGLVNDYANIIDETQEQQLELVLKQLYDSKVAEYSVVTINSLEGVSIESYSLELAQGVLGDKEKNNGLLLLVAVDDRQYRFEVGRGLEADLNDAKIGRIGRNYLVENFRAGDYGKGILEASLAVQSILMGDVNSTYYVSQAQAEEVDEDTFKFFIFLFFFIILFIIFSIGAGRRKGRYFDAAAGAIILFGGRGGSGGLGGGGFGGFGGGGFGGGGAGGGW